MNKHFCKIIKLQKCFLYTALAVSFNIKAETFWHLYKSKNGVSVYYQSHSNNTFEVKAQMSVEHVSTNDFLELLSDTDAAPQWLENVSLVEVIKHISPHENLVYSYFDSPWPVANRDSITYSCYSKINAQQSKLLIAARPNALSEKENAVRVRTLNATWLLTQQASALHIEYQIYALPSGAIPTWLNNKVGLKSTYKTLINLRNILTQKSYAATLPVIQAGKCN